MNEAFWKGQPTKQWYLDFLLLSADMWMTRYVNLSMLDRPVHAERAKHLSKTFTREYNLLTKGKLC